MLYIGWHVLQDNATFVEQSFNTEVVQEYTSVEKKSSLTQQEITV